ncbi:MAG: tetratricopeptide repeat protein [Gammaproteobacteria bacterium]|nr:tetratricopeptide repeat protein [Gammaproteobacteria bacterium]
MSLINQVLKDLEKRRAENVGSASGSFNTVHRYTVARSNNSFALYVLTTLALVMSAVAVFLIWDRDRNTFIVETAPSVEVMESTTAEKGLSVIHPDNEKPVDKLKMDNEVLHVASDSDSDKKVPTKNISNTQQVNENVVSRTEPARSKTDTKNELQSDALSFVSKQQRPLTTRQSTEVAFQNGFNALGQGKVKKAETDLLAALKLSPEHIKAREMLAGLYIKNGRYVEAGQLLFEGIGFSPEHTMYRKLYARVLLEQNNLTTAVKVLEQYLPAFDSDPDYHALLAALYQRQGKHENAAVLYQQMLKQNQSMGVWWIGLGISLEKLNKPDEARTAYEKARSSGTLAAQLAKYTDNRLIALKDIGYPD